jgi:hypothetical protein
LGTSNASASSKYKVGTSPDALASGDFNGDGIPDLAVANYDSGTVSILLGQSGGTFRPAIDFTVGPNPVSIAVGDFNGDKKLDLAVALHGTTGVAVMMGNGDGTFQPAAIYGGQSTTTAVATGDFNRDGKLDIAFTNDTANSVSILLGNGDGTFQSATSYTVGTTPSFLAVYDLSGDGKADIIVADAGSGDAAVLVGNGDGTFAAVVGYATGTGSSALALADFNGDGKVDLVVTNSISGNVSILLGNGDNTFQPAVNINVGANPTSVAVIDFNHDGKMDVVVANRASETISVLLGVGDGTFYGPLNYVVPGGPSALLIADFNGDSFYDLAVACRESSSLVVLFGQAGGSFPAVNNYAAGVGPNLVSNVAVADFNGDGKQDFVAFSRDSISSNLTIHFNNGDGTFQPGLTTNVGSAPNFLVAGDFDGDGKADIAFTNTTSTSLAVLIGAGDGTFVSSATYTVGTTPTGIAVGDFNRDGKKDLLVVTSLWLAVLPGNGDGTFQTAVITPATFSGSQPRPLVVADVNGDGIPDVVVADPATYSLFVFLGNGDDTFRLASRVPTGASPTSVAAGDLNGDGRVDLVVGNQSLSGTFSVFNSNGDGTFQAPVVFQPRAFPGTISAVAVGDFNGDGIMDIAAANNLSNQVFLILGSGHGAFQSPIAYDVGAYPSFLVASDLNANGKVDLAVGMGGGVSILLNTSPPSTVSINVSIPSGGAMSFLTNANSRSVQTGYARVSLDSGVTPYGTAVFSLTQNGTVVSETAVPASPPTRAAQVFVEYRTVNDPGSGSISVNTGIALVNEGSDTAHITCRLFDASGNLLAMGNGTLPSNSHYSAFISELSQWMPDFVLPGAFQTAIQFGALQIQSDQAFSVVALRLTNNQRGETLLTSTPIADLSKPLSSSSLFMPRLVDGGGWKTAFYLMNTSSSGIETGAIQLLDQNGVPLNVGLSSGSTGTSFRYSIQPNGVAVFQTDGLPATTNTGWIKVVPDTGTTSPTGIGLFGFTQGGVLVTASGIPSALPTTHARIYVDKSGGHNTGLAIANPGNGALNVTLSAYLTDGVTPAGTSLGSLTISPGGENAVFVDQVIPGLPDGFTGVLDVASSSPFVPLTLRSLTNSRGEFLITTFPVADFNQPAPSPIVFPQIVDGAGYQTEFILLSTQGTAAASINYYNNDGVPVVLQNVNR